MQSKDNITRLICEALTHAKASERVRDSTQDGVLMLTPVHFICNFIRSALLR